VDLLLAYGLSIGILAGLWTFVSATYSLPTWIGFVSWACYFAVVGAAGTKLNGLKRTVLSNLVGVVWGIVAIFIYNAMGASLVGLSVAVFIICIPMCVEAHWEPLSFIPGAFCGCACYFGNSLNWKVTGMVLVFGAVLAYLSDIAGVQISQFGSKKS
jgi:hypothetical protein